MEDYFGPAIGAMALIGLILCVVWLGVVGETDKRYSIECMSRSGIWLDHVCIRGEVLDLTKPA